MGDNFITQIVVEKSRNIENFEIPLSEISRQHLIITGKNGSGKTSLLQEINKFLTKIPSSNISKLEEYKKELKRLKDIQSNTNISQNNRADNNSSIKAYQNEVNSFGGIRLRFSGSLTSMTEKYNNGFFVLAFFDSKRHTALKIPNGINKIVLNQKYKLGDKANVDFIQYIVNMKADRSFARDDNELDTVSEIDNWFDRFEKRLKSIFDDDSLRLKFDRKTYNFNIIVDDSEPFGFNTLSDGYSAIISIVTELLLRMESHSSKSYDLQGVVVIDEIETHLHVDLQKKILPFLTDFFPKIQFIITTHSPFVLSSLSNVTICDLESKIVTTDLSGYSYDTLIESYFTADKYSDELKVKIKDLEKLIKIENPTTEERKQIETAYEYLSGLPKYLAKELHSKILDIEIDYFTKNNK